MPKQKTARGAAKRFTVMKSGKIKRAKAYRNHILTKKTTKRTRNLRKGGYVAAEDSKNIKRMLPHG